MPLIHVVQSANRQQYDQNSLADKFTFHIKFLNLQIESSLAVGVTTNMDFSHFISSLKTAMPEAFINQHAQIIRQIKILADKPKEQRTRSDLIHLLKLIQQFKVPGISRIETKDIASENQCLYDDIYFPEALIPKKYICNINMHIMDTPCQIKGGQIGKVALKEWFKTSGKNENPFTREVLLDFSVDNELAADIKLLLKKAQFLYYVFGGPEQYHNYAESLLNTKLLYQDFTRQILAEGHLRHTPELFFNRSSRTHIMLMPPASILNWFDLYDIDIINKPSKQDFQILIEKIIEKSDEYPARLLLDHPYLEVARIDVSRLKIMLDEKTRCTL